MKKDNLLKAVKQAILQQAIQGELTADWRAQHPEPVEGASELLKRIKAEKEKLINEKKIRKEKPLPPITEEEIPFELPKSWVWCRLGKVSLINGGYAFKSSQYTEKGIRVIRISDFDDKGFKNKSIVKYPFDEKLNSYLLEENSILMAMTGGTVGKTYLVKSIDEKMYVNQRVAAIKIIQPIISEYISSVFKTNIVQKVIKNAKNSTNDNISMSDIKGFFIPLPPLAEQKAIVEKVEKLMQQADAISQGANIDDFEVVDKKAHQLLKNYSIIKNILDEIIKQKEYVKQLKQSILQEAIQGKLTADWRKQNPDVEPASELLKRIKAEKEKLIAAKKIRKEKPLPPITQEEIPFELPKGWVWCRLGETAHLKRGKSPKYSPNGVPKMINQKCVRWFNVDISHCKLVDEEWCEKLDDSFKIISGDLLVNSTGDGTIGRSGIVDDYSKGFAFDSHVLRVRPYMHISTFFIALVINSKFGQQLIQNLKGAKSTKQTELGINNLSIFPTPLPPLAEQKTIVEKVETLMQKVSAMEEEIQKSEQNAEMLMQAVLKEAFEGKKEEVVV